MKYILNAAARYGLSNLPKGVYLAALKLILMYHMKPTDAVALYNRYIGDWGGTSTSYRFEAVKNGKVVKVVRKEPVTSMHLSAEPDHQNLTERNTYEAAEIRIRALDQNDNIVSFTRNRLYCRRRDQSPSLDLKSFPCREAWAALMSERPGKKASGF